MSCGHVPQMVAESPAQAHVNDHVDRGVDHQQQMVDMATNDKKCRDVKFIHFFAMLKYRWLLQMIRKSLQKTYIKEFLASI